MELDIEIEPQIQNNDDQMNKYWQPKIFDDAWKQSMNYHKPLIIVSIFFLYLFWCYWNYWLWNTEKTTQDWHKIRCNF